MGTFGPGTPTTAGSTRGSSRVCAGGVAEPEAEGKELLGDLQVGQGRGERDIGVAAVIAAPGAVGLDGADAGHGAVGDVDEALEPVLAGGRDEPPLAVGLQLDGFVLAGLAVAAAGVVDLARPGVAVDDQDAVAAVLAGGPRAPASPGARCGQDAAAGRLAVRIVPRSWPAIRTADGNRLPARPEPRLRPARPGPGPGPAADGQPPWSRAGPARRRTTCYSATRPYRPAWG